MLSDVDNFVFVLQKEILRVASEYNSAMLEMMTHIENNDYLETDNLMKKIEFYTRVMTLYRDLVSHYDIPNYDLFIDEVFSTIKGTIDLDELDKLVDSI